LKSINYQSNLWLQWVCLGHSFTSLARRNVIKYESCDFMTA
jgi:hypothetical protein